MLLSRRYDLMSGKKMQPATLSPTASEVPAASDFLFDDLVDELPRTARGRVLVLVAAAGGDRLDKWLVGQLPERSRSEIQRWIEAGLVVRRLQAVESKSQDRGRRRDHGRHPRD